MEESNENRLLSYLQTVSNDQILSELNDNVFPFYSTILQSARSVFSGNLPQKVQDQLVLIEEVFSNSKFTNNVNSGNLGEVIDVVTNDIEETRLLNTDLLGDAIESALSETGGTKDIGLFRTLDHIRQFMTFNEYKVLKGQGRITKLQADKKAAGEYDEFNKTQKIISDFDKEIQKLKKK